MAINDKDFYASHGISFDIEEMQIEYTKRVIKQAKIEALTELKTEIDIMSDSVVEGRTITITSWNGMQKRICKLIQSKIDKLEENINDTNTD